MKRLLIGCLLLLTNSYSPAQDFSNRGTDFWLAYPAHIDGNTSRMALYIASAFNTTGTVELAGTTINFSVVANQATVVQISPATYNVINAQNEGINTGKGIHVISSQPIVLYAHILNAARSGSSLILPSNTLGREYTVASIRSMSNSTSNATNGSPAGSQFTVVGVENATTVEITPTAPDVNNTRTVGVPFTVTLNKGDVYQYRTSFSNDVTGTKVRSLASATVSCKPIAVFSGSSWTTLNCTNASGGDNLFQQLMPKSAWGKNYVTAPFADRQYDVFRIIVDDPTTIVTLNGAALNPGTLINGTYYEFTSTTGNVISTNKPVMVIQYLISQTCDSRNNGSTGANAPFPGDPEMVIINPIEQTLNDVTVVSAHRDLTPPQTNITKHFFTIIMKSNATASLRIDGAVPTANFIPIGTSGYSYIQQNVTSTTTLANPSHRITADSGFIALAYGLGNVESYGYNAGTNVKDLYQFVTLQNQFASVNFPATCKNTPFFFSITLPYQPTSLSWNFNNNVNLSPNANIVNNSPVADSSFVRDGRTLYVYKLQGIYNFSATGTYPIKVVANNPTPDGCSGLQEINYDVVVYNPPVADWSFTHTGCIGDSVRFTDISNALGRSFIKWNWDFGDGTTDSVRNPVKKYPAPGNYSVRLRPITDIGCIGDTTKALAISSQPIAKFVLNDTTCIGKTITFIDSSTIAVGTIVKWTWDFGNGQPPVVNNTNASVTQTFSVAGPYLVTLIVESNTGCKSVVFSKTINIRPNPVVDFQLPGGLCLPAGNAQFSDLSTISDGTQTQFTYLWNFGDGGTAVTKNPTHFYTSSGPFDIKLKVTTVYGCIDSLSKNLSTIYPQAKANFSVLPEVCLRDSTVFIDSSNGMGNTVVKWRWSFGDGNTDTTQNPKHRYATANATPYTVKLFVITDKGCNSDTMTKTTVVNPLPTADFNFSSPVCQTKDISFNPTSSSANVGTLVRLRWDMGNGVINNFTNGNSFTQNYAAVGNYTVKLVVENSKGCISDTTPKTVSVNMQPKPNFILPEVCLNDTYAQFLDSSYVGDGTDSSLTYLWNFGDQNANASNPNTSTLKHPQHKYTDTGSYTVKLTVTTNKGCTDSISKAFFVNGSFPISDFSILNSTGLCSNLPVQIQNKSTVFPGVITKVEIYWDYLDNPLLKQVDNNPTFNKIYSNKYPDFQQPLTKTYSIRFVAYSGGTCSHITTKTVTVNASPKTQFLTIPGICLDAGPRQITQASETGGVPGTFSYSGIGVSSSGLFTPANTGEGNFAIQYLYVSNMGCRDSASKPITVWPSPTAKFGFSNPTCEKNAITFSDSSVANFSNITSWNWNFGDGNIATYTTSAAFPKTFALANNYTVTLRVVTDSGCASTPTAKPVNVNYLPRVSFTNPTICLPDGTGTFQSTSTIPDGTENQFVYTWDFGDGGSGTGANATHRYFGVGPYNVKLKVVSVNGCIDSATQYMNTIFPQPAANFSIQPLSKEVCAGDPFSFTENSTSPSGVINQWVWRFGDNTTSAIKNPTHTYINAGSYNVSLFAFDAKGCVSDTMTETVIVHDYPVVNAGPDMFVLQDGTGTINATATGNGLQYAWLPVLYLDSPNVLKPKVIFPQDDITYTLTVTGLGGCQSTDQVFVKVLKTPQVPNAFSPNGDGINDRWNIKYLESYPGCTVEVFNRQGQLVFASTDGYTKPWDGTNKGNVLPVGTYYYVIDPKNGRKKLSGSITILR